MLEEKIVSEMDTKRTIQDTFTNKNVGWNDKIEMAAKDIGEASKSYKILHIQQSQKTNKIYNRLMIIGIIMGPLSGMTSALGPIFNPENEYIIQIIATILGFISGIVVSVIKFGKYDEASNANKQAAARYTSLESNVRRQLSLYRSDRVSANIYMEWLETKYEELFLSAPLLPADVYEKYLPVTKNNNLQIPKRYTDVIEINTQYEQMKIGDIINVSNIEVNNKKEYSSQDDIETGKIQNVSSFQKIKGEKKLKRTSTMSQFPHLNQYSDKMLEYEMKRMMGFSL